MPIIGQRGRAEISYYYSTTPLKPCQQSLFNVTKPVIVIDGIDHAQERNGRALFNRYLFYKDAQNRNQNLGAELRIAGYDVVIMDHPNITRRRRIGGGSYEEILRHGGSDYMERNAYALVKLIQTLNQQMRNANSSEQIVVVGPSMGGQIARFALAYMEKRYNDPNDALAYQKLEWRHNVRLYVSLDSPHNGANIPLGLQHFVNIFAAATKETDLVAGLAELNSPAARELTLQHHTQGTASLPDPLRTSFVNTLSSLGNFPSQLRRIAVTNGSLNGTRQSDQNGQVIRAGERAFFLEQRGIPCCGAPGVIARLLWPFAAIARTITTASAKVYYAPEYGQISQVTRTYLFQPGSHHGERTRDATGLPGSCSLDGAPGGYRGFFNSFVNGTYRGDPFEKFTIYSPRDKACFIPTLSGLAYNRPADNCTPLNGQNLVCAGTTPFDAYYGPLNRNEDHIQLTPGNVEFMRNEILGKTPTPIFIEPSATLCPNSAPIAFRVKAECVASRPGQSQLSITYTWTPSPGLQIVSGQGTATVVVQPSPGFTGTATLQVVATRTGNAASIPASVSVQVGGSYLSIGGPSGEECYYSELTYSLNSSLTQGNTVWEVYLNNARHDEFITQNYSTSAKSGEFSKQKWASVVG